jgi:hypothetical protein
MNLEGGGQIQLVEFFLDKVNLTGGRGVHMLLSSSHTPYLLEVEEINDNNFGINIFSVH